MGGEYTIKKSLNFAKLLQKIADGFLVKIEKYSLLELAKNPNMDKNGTPHLIEASNLQKL